MRKFKKIILLGLSSTLSLTPIVSMSCGSGNSLDDHEISIDNLNSIVFQNNITDRRKPSLVTTFGVNPINFAQESRFFFYKTDSINEGKIILKMNTDGAIVDENNTPHIFDLNGLFNGNNKLVFHIKKKVSPTDPDEYLIKEFYSLYKQPNEVGIFSDDAAKWIMDAMLSLYRSPTGL